MRSLLNPLTICMKIYNHRCIDTSYKHTCLLNTYYLLSTITFLALRIPIKAKATPAEVLWYYKDYFRPVKGCKGPGPYPVVGKQMEEVF